MGETLLSVIVGFIMFLVSIAVAGLALIPSSQNWTYSFFKSTASWATVLWIASAIGITTTTLTFSVLEVSWKPDLNVVARIIATLYVDGPTNRTNLSSKSGLNYKSFRRYLQWMTGHSLVEMSKDEEGLRVFLTQTGQASYAFFNALIEGRDVASAIPTVTDIDGES